MGKNKRLKQGNQFDYGDSVRVKDSAPKKYFPGEPGDICGMDQLTVKEEAQQFLCEISDWVYTVEFSDGSAMEIAECYLEIDPDRLKYALKEQVILKNAFSNTVNLPEIVSIIDYHKITGKSLAEKYKMKLGDFIYVIEDQSGKISLIPESFIEKKLSP